MKRRFVYCISALLILILPSIASAQPGPFAHGDMNCDGDVDVVDVLLAITMALDMEMSAEIDGNGDNFPDACPMPGVDVVCGSGTVLNATGDACVMSQVEWDAAWLSGFSAGEVSVDITADNPVCDWYSQTWDGMGCVAACLLPPDPCEPNPCQNGGVCSVADDQAVCTCPPGMGGSDCAQFLTGFAVLESQDITYSGIDYVLLKVALNSTTSMADNWCYDYRDLCQAFDGVPTGCGDNFDSGGYGDCKETYSSVGVSNTLGCNPSGGVASAAQQAGYSDATSTNSFAFHSCGGSCEKEMCNEGYCNTALSYISASEPFGYTLCKKIPGGCGIGIDVDINNCGACGFACPTVANGAIKCESGGCIIQSCESGFADCDGVYENGCEISLMDDAQNCGACGSVCGSFPGEQCVTGVCESSTSSFTVLESQDITYAGIDYVLLKVELNSMMSVAENWCYEYQDLCQGFDTVPTGCGDNFDSGGYGDCKETYSSVGVSNSLGCNPSGGVASAAQQAGYSDASSMNSFAFHSCGGSCHKQMCDEGSCNTALSYISVSEPVGYTLCKKIPGGCGIGIDVDINNCGACGFACPQVANGAIKCESGGCIIQSCESGYADCDGLYANGCEISLMENAQNCGSCGHVCGAWPGEQCVAGVCESSNSSFTVLESQDITYGEIAYVLLKVELNSMMSVAENWCYEYLNLCQAYGGVPTGCGDNFDSGGYGDCKETYLSDGVSNTLGCNPSGGVSSAAQQAGYSDATSMNSFAFHSCGGNCHKQMCDEGSCNTALSYISVEQPFGYTLCKMP